MLAEFGWLSATRLTGLISFGASTLACAARWMGYRRVRLPGQTFAILAAIQLGLVLDIAFDFRWMLHDAGIRAAIARGVYEQRGVPQQMGLWVLVCALVLASVCIAIGFRHRIGAGLAFWSASRGLGLWCVEVVSYHVVDKVLYEPVGGVMLVGLIWVTLALMTCAGVWLDYRRVAPTLE